MEWFKDFTEDILIDLTRDCGPERIAQAYRIALFNKAEQLEEAGHVNKPDILIDLMRRARPHIGDEYARQWPTDEDFDQMLVEYDTAISWNSPDPGDAIDAAMMSHGLAEDAEADRGER